MITLASLPESVLSSCGIDLFQLADAVNAAKLSEKNESHMLTKSVFSDDDQGAELDTDGDDDMPIISTSPSGELDFNAQKEAFEKEFIIKALKTFKGRINQTALHANIPKKTLLRKIEKYGINAKDYVS